MLYVRALPPICPEDFPAGSGTYRQILLATGAEALHPCDITPAIHALCIAQKDVASDNPCRHNHHVAAQHRREDDRSGFAQLSGTLGQTARPTKGTT
jgi:hypothetical protein